MTYKLLNERQRSTIQTFVANGSIKLADIKANLRDDIVVDIARSDSKSVAMPKHYEAADKIIAAALSGNGEAAIRQMPAYAYQIEQLCFVAEVVQMLKDKNIVVPAVQTEQPES